MTDSQHPVPLDVAARGALRKAKFDPRIADSVQTLSQVGINIPPDSPPGYVMAAWLERMEGLREARRSNAELAKQCRAKAKRLQRQIDALPPDSEEAKKIEAEIAACFTEAKEYDTAHIQFACRVGEAGKDIMHLHEKMRATGPAAGPGAVSWDPDAPQQQQQVNLQVNVAGPAAVTVEKT